MVSTRSRTSGRFMGGSGNDAYFRALNAAFGTVATEIVDWTASSI